MNLNFDSIKDELLLENNFKTLLSSLEFYIALEIPKEEKTELALNVYNDLKDNVFNFDLDRASVLIESLNAFDSYLLGDLKIIEDDFDFKINKQLYLSTIPTMLKLLRKCLRSNGFDFRFKKTSK